MLEDVAERGSSIERPECRGPSFRLGELRSQLLDLPHQGRTLQTDTLPFALCALDRSLKFSPRRILALAAPLDVFTTLLEIPICLSKLLRALREILAALLEITIGLFEFLPALIEIPSMSLDLLVALLELALECFAGTPQVVETPTGDIELIAHVAELALESSDLRVRVALRLFPLS